ncbi:MAG: ParA family protein, partial [Planctomycetia bacterium]|nr:ParA family protein [Planctomycetia bacterium]
MIALAATEYNVPMPHRASYQGQTGLRDFLAEVRGGYGVVFIDCPPNLHLCSWAALVASDFIIVPLQAEDYGAQGTIEVQESIDQVLALANPRLDLLGYLM